MPGTIAPPSSDVIPCASAQDEDVYNCSRCKEAIPLSPNQEIQSICQTIQDHLEQCISSKISGEPSCGLSASGTLAPLVNLYMPLQPRRTWSAEDERRKRLEEDPDAYDVGPHTVTCAGCHRPIRLNATGRYYAANWNKHKMGCKNTNAVSGAGVITAVKFFAFLLSLLPLLKSVCMQESKFTGKVAAFRVAKPSESSEPFTRSPTAGPSDMVTHFSPQANAINQASDPRGSSADKQYVQERRSVPNQQTQYSDPNHPSHIRVAASPIHINPVASRVEPLTRSFAPRTSKSSSMPLLNGSLAGLGPSSSGHLWNGEKVEKSKPASDFPTTHSMHREREDLVRVVRSSTLPMSGSALKGKGRPGGPQSADAIPVLFSPEPSPPHRHTSSALRDRSSMASETRVHTVQRSSSSALQHRLNERIHPVNSTLRNLRDSAKDRFSPYSNDGSGDFGITGSEGHQETPNTPKSNQRLFVDSHNDVRALPSLSSLTLSRTNKANNASLFLDQRSVSAGVVLPPLRPQRRQEQELAWSQANPRRFPADDIESVQLPPIRAVSFPSPTYMSSTRTKRRLGLNGEAENEILEDRPSPPKVLIQLREQPDNGSTMMSASNLVARDASPRFAFSRSSPRRQSPSPDHASKRPSSAESSGTVTTEVTGAEVSRPPSSLELPPTSENDAQRGNDARLHPVWKWEQQGNLVESTHVSQVENMQANASNRDVSMDERDAS
ncbi:hypothetical protein DFH11DRAFT_1619269 [Phellopilus nigrolimitatus]|nr:hypothetical protein DFH11DRAFT_1619269 [Phellopilus nigrolimitatus]